MTRNRKGRPKNTPRPKIDMGTDQLQDHRRRISPKDPTLATCPLDALKSKGIITADMFSAAEHFRACHHTKFGSPHPKAVDILKASGSPYLGDTKKAEAGYKSACDVLRSLSRQHLDAIENIVVYERFADWMFHERKTDRAMIRAKEGFSALVAWDRKTVRKAA